MLSIRSNSRVNYKEIKKDTQIIAKIKSFIDKCNWEGMNYPPSEEDD